MQVSSRKIVQRPLRKDDGQKSRSFSRDSERGRDEDGFDVADPATPLKRKTRRN
jgi:hypothetical protein